MAPSPSEERTLGGWWEAVNPANLVTTIRAAGLGLITAWWLTHLDGDPARQLMIVAVGTGCLVLDGVDGHLARRLKVETARGARYDMEVDAALIAVLSLVVVQSGIAGAWVLAIGAMRYGYVLAALLMPQLRTPLPPRLSRKVVAVLQAAALLAALLFDVVGAPSQLTTAVLVSALVALVASFGRDATWQLRRPTPSDWPADEYPA